MLTLIAAISQNNALGFKGQLLWHLPDDFKHFKSLTTGHCIIMGRKTWDTLPGLLPHRQHIVITRDNSFHSPNAQVAHSLDKALEISSFDPNPFVIGGGEIYRLAMEKATRIELTRVHHRFDQADAFFPEIDEKEWRLIHSTYHPRDDRHAYDFSFETYLRNS